MVLDYLNRSLCSVLEDMRTCFKTYNFSPMLGLIEEAQVMGNRMEAALEDGHDIEMAAERRAELKKKLKVLKKEIADLEARKKELEG